MAIGAFRERAEDLPAVETRSLIEPFVVLQHARSEPRFEPEMAAPETGVAKKSGPPSGDSLLCAGGSLRWLRRDPATWSAANEDVEQQAVLAHNLRAIGQRQIAMEAVLHDPCGQRVIGRLTAIFREAGWSVSEAPPSAQAHRAPGLVIAAAQCPLPRAATATYMALQAAGFPMSACLDGALGPEEWILSAGSAGERPR